MPRKNPCLPARSVKPQARRIGLSPLQEHRLRFLLRQSACSEAWVDAQFQTRIDRAPDGQLRIDRHHDPHAFPPGGAKRTAMRWCRSCGRYTPPCAVHLIESRHRLGGPVVSATLQCEDCRIGQDEEIHRELYTAFPHLRPAGGMSLVHRRQLYARSRSRTP